MKTANSVSRFPGIDLKEGDKAILTQSVSFDDCVVGVRGYRHGHCITSDKSFRVLFLCVYEGRRVVGMNDDRGISIGVPVQYVKKAN